MEHVADRMIAETRQGITSHSQLRELGILSPSQLERRRAREVYSNTQQRGGLEDGEFDAAIMRGRRPGVLGSQSGLLGAGVFGRVYRPRRYTHARSNVKRSN